MADETLSSKPLNPMASPYHKLPPTCPYHFFIFKLTPSYQVLSPASPFCAYNINLQPLSRKPVLPPLSPFSGKKIQFSLNPVPSGPRIPKSRSSARSRRLKNVVRAGDGNGNELRWRPKNNAKADAAGKGQMFERKKRWKNTSGEYQRILPLETDTTTVMIKNIPNKYTRKLLIQTLDHHCKIENAKIKNDDKDFVSAYDFLYLPIDFNHRANAGFAFVNFTSPEAASTFRDAFHGKRWDFFDSPKIAEISRARIQGKEALINNCKIMNFSYGSEEDLPVWFDPARCGSGRVASKMKTVGRFPWNWSK